MDVRNGKTQQPSPLTHHVDGSPVLGLLRPFRHVLRSLAFQGTFTLPLLPIRLDIPKDASRV